MATNYPNGVSSYGIPQLGDGIPTATGSYFFVDSGNGNATISGPGTKDSPFSTIDSAIGACTENAGDVIIVAEGHAETIATAGALAIDVAGVTIVGLGVGDNRPTLTLSATASTIAQSANNTKFLNFILVPSINAVVSPLAITGDGCEFSVKVKDASDSVECVRGVLATGADRLKGNLEYVGRTGGSACVNGIRLVGCNNVDLTTKLYGKASTAWVEFLTTACTDVTVSGYMYNSGTTNGSKLVVDTVTGSTWYCEIMDGAAGAKFSGGSGAALALDDISAVATAVTNLGSALAVPTADATTNVNERDVIGNKTDASVNTVGTTKSIIAYVKGLVQTLLSGAATDGSGNGSIVDVVGNKNDAAVYQIGTTNSILAYVKGLIGRGDSTATKSAAVISNGLTLFTVAGGPIEILSLTSVCVTPNNGTASTLQYSADGTDGSATTFSGASASLASVAAGTIVALDGTSLATAPSVYANGVGGGQVKTVIVPAGVITAVVAVGSTTGTWSHNIRYRPLVRGVTVS